MTVAGPNSTNNEHDYAKPRSQIAQRLPPSTLTELTIPKPPTEARTVNHDVSQRLHHSGGLLTTSQPPSALAADGEEPGADSSICKPYSGRSMRRTESEKNFGLKKSETVIKSIPENDRLSLQHNHPATSSATSRLGPTYAKRKEVVSLDKLKKTLRGPVTACETGAATGVGASSSGGAGGGAVTPLYTRRTSSRQRELRAASRQQPDLTLETIKDTLYSQRITLESLSTNEAKVMSGLLQQASLEKLGSSSISNFSPVRTRKSSIAGASGTYHTTEDLIGAEIGSAVTPVSVSLSYT